MQNFAKGAKKEKILRKTIENERSNGIRKRGFLFFTSLYPLSLVQLNKFMWDP